MYLCLLIEFQISTQYNQLILFYLPNQTVMEFLDLSTAHDDNENEGDRGDVGVPELFWIMNKFPQTSRYIYCVTTTHAICIWDLHKRRCVRIIETGIGLVDMDF